MVQGDVIGLLWELVDLGVAPEELGDTLVLRDAEVEPTTATFASECDDQAMPSAARVLALKGIREDAPDLDPFSCDPRPASDSSVFVPIERRNGALMHATFEAAARAHELALVQGDVQEIRHRSSP